MLLQLQEGRMETQQDRAEKQRLLGGGRSELRLRGFALAGPQVFNWDLQFL